LNINITIYFHILNNITIFKIINIFAKSVPSVP